MLHVTYDRLHVGKGEPSLKITALITYLINSSIKKGHWANFLFCFGYFIHSTGLQDVLYRHQGWAPHVMHYLKKKKLITLGRR